MRLVASTAELVRSELFDRIDFARALGFNVPEDWPPDEAADALPWFLEQLERADPRDVGWYGFYGIAVDGAEPVLVGGGGSLGPPVDGSAEIGYSVLPAFQHRGFALEMMAAGNVPSRNLLGRLGFAETGPGREVGSLRFARSPGTAQPI